MSLLTFVITDVADSAELGRHEFFGSDEQSRNHKYQEYVNRPYKDRVLALAKPYGGRKFSDGGDALFLVFNSPISAVRCAVTVLQSFRSAPLPTIPERVLHLHVGIHVGHADEDLDGNFQGDGVNTAARIETLAGKDQIVMSCQTQQVCDDISDLRFHRLGDFFPRGIGHLVLWEVDWDGNGPRKTKKPPVRPDLDQPPLIEIIGRTTELVELDGLLGQHRGVCVESISGLALPSHQR